MGTSEYLKLTGYYTFEAVDIRTNKTVQKVVIKNTITQAFYNKLFEFLNYDTDTPAAEVLGINYLAIGDDSTAVTRADTTLAAEILRKAPSTISYTGSVFTVKTIISAPEGNPTGGIILEAGIFADGTASADSGNLISRAVVNIKKNSNIVLYVTWTMST